MLHTVHQVLGRKVEGDSNQRLGTLADLLVDSFTWDVRYLVIDTGHWLAGRQVLIAPKIIGPIDWNEQDHSVHLPLTSQQIEQSPAIDSGQFVTRQQERDLADYFGWTGYWSDQPQRDPAQATIHPEETFGAEADLRSTREVIGYFIEATDGELGHIDDLLLDLQTWIIRYLIVKTRNWLPGRHVLLSPAWIEAIHWERRHARVNLSRAQIEASPEYDPQQPIDRPYETALHDSYDRPKYWLW